MWNSEYEFTGTKIEHLGSGNQTTCVTVVAAASSPLGQASPVHCGGGGMGGVGQLYFLSAAPFVQL